MARFAELSESDLSCLLAEKDAKNTKKATNVAINKEDINKLNQSGQSSSKVFEGRIKGLLRSYVIFLQKRSSKPEKPEKEWFFNRDRSVKEEICLQSEGRIDKEPSPDWRGSRNASYVFDRRTALSSFIVWTIRVSFKPKERVFLSTTEKGKRRKRWCLVRQYDCRSTHPWRWKNEEIVHRCLYSFPTSTQITQSELLPSQFLTSVDMKRDISWQSRATKAKTASEVMRLEQVWARRWKCRKPCPFQQAKTRSYLSTHSLSRLGNQVSL